MQQEISNDNLKLNVAGVTIDDGTESVVTTSETDVTVTVVDRLKNKPTINVLALVCMGFFWVSGGMYGNEELMSVGSPVYALPCLLVVPILYSCPVSLINSEMASAMPWEGGAVAWIGEALGETLGAHTAYWIWFASVLDSSLYPRFAAAYLAKQFDFTHVEECFTAMAIVILINIVKLCGLKSVVSLSILLCVIAISPSFILVGLGFSKINWSVLGDNSGAKTNFSELMTWVLWLYQGVLSMGSVSKDVKNAGKTYLLSSLILFTLDVLIVNFTPLLISLSIDGDRTQYHAGHFIKIGNTLGHGKWLGVLLTVASQISLIGLYQSGSLASDQYLSRFLHTYVLPETSSARIRKIVSGSPPNSPKRKVHTWLFENENDSGVPRVMVLINCLIVMCSVWTTITDTMTVSVLLMTLGIGLLTVSFLIIKFTRPDLHRGFSLPGGRVGAVCVAFPCLALVMLNIGLSLSDTSATIHGIPVRSVAFVVVVSVGVAVHAVARFFKNHISKREDGLLRAAIMPIDQTNYGTEATTA
eukprot:c6122_g1_i1.p1 GENE.c6122_g1_i1~~c6122_g1_i1.p1  ORF type:complete len:530 (-),score=66.09 c6122_g1_i1:151-1740(-)